MVAFTNYLFCQQKKDGSLSHRTVLEEITSTYDDLGMRCERDAFDTLFDHAPDKLQVVKKVCLSYACYVYRCHFEMSC
jgi:parvin